MQTSEKVIKGFNQQIGNEMGASLQYVNIAAYFDAETLPELAKFFYRQADEEREHAMKFVKFILDVDGQVEIPAIPAPKANFKSAEEAVQLSLDWEREVTEQIYKLVEGAKAENNYMALRFLDWFVDEQREEVATMSALLAVVRRAGDDLLHVEEYLARQGPSLEAEGPAG